MKIPISLWIIGISSLLCALLSVGSFAFVHSARGRTNKIVGAGPASRTSLARRTTRCHAASEPNVPTFDELSRDDFMKQVSHSQKIVSMLASDSNGDVVELLKAQLAHSDGIRGFFVTYLTGEGSDSPADQPQVPNSLLQAMNESVNEKELISLACMNVIMPTGMKTMHRDPALAANSKKTAERAVRVLRSLRHKPLVKEECRAIIEAANGATTGDTEVDAAKVAYWKDFYVKWGYEDVQKRDIAKAAEKVLAE